MRVLVCGDRNWKNRDYIFKRLTEMDELYGFTDLIEGCARGADRFAEDWAMDEPVTVHHFPANWAEYGKAAGPIRNKQMLVEGKPDIVIAFHTNLQDSKGTKHMVELAHKAGVQTFVFPHHE